MIDSPSPGNRDIMSRGSRIRDKTSFLRKLGYNIQGPGRYQFKSCVNSHFPAARGSQEAGSHKLGIELLPNPVHYSQFRGAPIIYIVCMGKTRI